MTLSGSSGGAPAEISTINIKLPKFWSSDSELWFLMVEATFCKHEITKYHNKFDYLVTSLLPSAASLIRDVIHPPLGEWPYDSLREALIRHKADLEECRPRQPLTFEKLGDSKSPEVLCRMPEFPGDKEESIGGAILRALFLQRLPAQVWMILSTSTSEALETIARTAN